MEKIIQDNFDHSNGSNRMIDSAFMWFLIFKEIRSVLAADDLPFLLLSHKANAVPALFGHLSEVFHASHVHFEILSFLFCRFFAKGVGSVNIVLTNHLLVFSAFWLNSRYSDDKAKQDKASNEVHRLLIINYNIDGIKWIESLKLLEV